MRRRFTCLTLLATGALALSAATPAFAGPIEDLLDPGNETGGNVITDTVDYLLDLAVIDNPGLQIRAVQIVNEAYAPIGGTVSEQRDVASHSLLDAIETGDLIAVGADNAVDDRVGAVEAFLDNQCGSCTPGLGGIIGPVPVGPVGDEARYQANEIIARANALYAGAGARINNACGNCTPGLGGIIGPVPVGPVGDPAPPT